MTNLLPAKLFIPHTRPELVARSRILQQLDQGLQKPLTLVSAPAGFGKTTLAADWIEHLRSNSVNHSEIDIVWLSLDEADNDFNRFLTYFFTALSQIKSLDLMPLLERTKSPIQPPIEIIFSPLLTALSTIKNKIILVLDDYHLIENLTIHQAINFWFENTPLQVHTVVLTREDPPFPLARLRARNHLTELRSADLRFTASEAAQFLNDIMGLGLDEKSVSILEENTEGWIAGLQMAALSMRNRKDLDQFIKNFSGTNRYIMDYLLEEVLASQTPEIQEFLLITSILRRLSAPLCDALLQEDEKSAAILEYLEQANLFLIPLDDERCWYRYHHLFTDLLRSRLQQSCSKEKLADYHTRSAQWYEDNGMAYGAIYHASLIPNDEWVERIIDQNYMDIFQRRASASIRYWTGELGKELIFKRPQLAIHEANSRAWFGQLDEADQLLEQAEKRLNVEKTTPETQAMYGYLAYVKSRVTAMRGDFKQAVQLALHAQKSTPASNQGLLGGIGVMLGYGYFLNGDFTQAAQVLEKTIESGKKFGAINTTSGAYCVLARLCAIQGKLQKAYDLYQEAENFIRQSEGEHLGAMSILDVGFAEILYEWNDLESASKHIQQGLDLLPLWIKADDFALAYVIHSQLHQAHGNSLAAEETIKKGSHVILTNGVFSEAQDAVITAEINLLLSQGNSIVINRRIKSIENRLAANQPYQFKNELVLITLARVYLVQKNFEQALNLLANLEAHAQAEGRIGRLLKILNLQSLLIYEKGEPSQAYIILEKALRLAVSEGYIRTFIDEGEAMQRLLSKWVNQAEIGPLKSYANQLIAQFEERSISVHDQHSALKPQTKLIEPLTEREIEVLNLIALGKTNKEISVELIVSPGTVKAHTSNIYRKLDVANRTEAVSHARKLDILS